MAPRLESTTVTAACPTMWPSDESKGTHLSTASPSFALLTRKCASASNSSGARIPRAKCHIERLLKTRIMSLTGMRARGSSNDNVSPSEELLLGGSVVRRRSQQLSRNLCFGRPQQCRRRQRPAKHRTPKSPPCCHRPPGSPGRECPSPCAACCAARTPVRPRHRAAGHGPGTNRGSAQHPYAAGRPPPARSTPDWQGRPTSLRSKGACRVCRKAGRWRWCCKPPSSDRGRNYSSTLTTAWPNTPNSMAALAHVHRMLCARRAHAHKWCKA
mmetsp:Transcript_70525/g.178752  ORF Transcript_70525/g.178752 Transcript_70525/m.178752 type:complete len:271 (-) Transcript_70525:27-839(-)